MQHQPGVNEKGQSLVEVALILALVALVAIALLQLFGVSLGDVFCRVVIGIGVESDLCTVDSGAIFRDDFGGDLSGWDLLMGNRWEQRDGQLCAGPGHHRAVAPGSNGGDYAVSVDANLERGWGYGIFFRTSFDDNGRLQGYIFQYDPGYGSGAFLYRRWVNGYETSPFARHYPAGGYQWFGASRHIEITVSGNTMTTRIDGETVLVAQDDTFQSGQAGLRTWASSTVCFDNLVVTTP